MPGRSVMEFWLSDRIRLAALLAFCVLLSSIEVLVPLFQYRRGRVRRALPNLVLALGVVLTNLAMASITASVSAVTIRHKIGLFSGMRSHPWLLLGLGVAGLDLFSYLAHLLLHKIPAG